MEHIAEHIIKNIKNATLIDEPFGHKFINDIFPKNFYEELINNLPLKSQYIPITESGTVSADYSPERFVFNFLDKSNMNKLSKEKKIFFNEFLRVLLSQKLFQEVTSMFREIIDNRLKNFTEIEKQKLGSSNFKFSIRTMLVKDFTKYNLGAHTDSVNKFVTFLFYIPSDNNLSDIGTSLYKPIVNIDSNKHRHFTIEQTKKNFKKIKTCPFVPNSLFLFPRTKSSFHGVEEVNIEQKERNLLLLNYYIDKKL